MLHVRELEAGFHWLYELKPAEARAQFGIWQEAHPNDPLGGASEAAGYLFEECYRQCVLTSDFFGDNNRFLGKVALKPDAEVRAAFFAAGKRARELAQRRLKEDPDDTNALFAMTLSVGLQADYASLIDKHQVESLKMIGEADKYAKRLLVVAPEAADAYLHAGHCELHHLEACRDSRSSFSALPVSMAIRNWASGSLRSPPPGGHYLRPFAKIMPALAAFREKKPQVARASLRNWLRSFPKTDFLSVS